MFSSVEPNEFGVFPNPTTSELNLIAKRGDVVEVVDLYGRVVLTKRIEHPEFRLKLDHIRSGLYVLQIRLSNEVIYTERIVKE
jgi:hypothetical protein